MESLLASIVTTAREPMLVLDADLTVRLANAAFHRQFNLSPEETAGRPVYALGNGQWDIPALHDLLEKLLPRRGACDGFAVEHSCAAHGRRTLLLNARRIDPSGMIVLAVEDSSASSLAEENLHQAALFPEENPFPVLRIGGDGCLLFANRSAAGLLREWGCRIGDTVPAAVRRILAAALDTGTNQELEVRCGERALSLIVVPINDRGYVNLYGRDITERKQAEQFYLASQQILRTVFDNVPVAVALIRGDDLRLQLVNQLYRGIAPGKEMTGKTLDELWPETGQDFTAICRGVLATGEPYRVEDELNMIRRNPDGPVEPAYFSWSLHRVRLPGEAGWGLLNTAWETTTRKRIEDQLSDSERRYRELVENANSAIIRWKADGTLVFFNEFAQRFFGYRAEDIIGRSVNFLLPDKESSGADLSTLVTDIVSHPERHTLNVNENVCRDGRRVWMAWTNRPIYGPDGQVGEILAIGSDITALKVAEDALRENEERLLLALDAAYVISFEWDIERNQVRRFVSHERALAATPEEQPATFEDVVAVVHPDDRQLFRANVAAALAREDGGYVSEFRIVRPDGEIVWLFERGRVKRDEAGRPIRLIGLSQDVSKRRLDEQALRQSEERFRQLADTMPQLVWTADANGRVDYYNERYREFKGFSQQADGSWAWSPVLHPEDLDRTVTAWQEALRNRSVYQIEHRVQRADGEYAWYLSRAKPVLDQAGRVVKWFGTATDINDLKLAELLVEAARASADKANQAKSDFLAAMSHEIRTPMTVFLMALEQLHQINTDPGCRELLSLADRSARALRELVDDILDISQIEACRVKLLEEPFDPRACVAEVSEMFKLAAAEKGLSLTQHVEHGVPRMIVADPFRLKQVLVNLVGNAIKFTSWGGVEVAIRPAGKALEFAVTDTGIGIPEDSHHLLFQNFSQVDSPLHRRHGGSGLGLAICKGLVELMGGTISMHNREGGGSIFSFTIPLKTVAGQPATTDNRMDGEGSSSSRAVRVLLAEDEPMVRDIVTLAMTRQGWRVETAGSGHEALARWQSEPFDVILMDLQLPEMSGLEATRAIRAHEAGTDRRIAIIGFTAHASAAVAEDCIRAGMDYVLGKPLHFDDLAAAINQCLAD